MPPDSHHSTHTAPPELPDRAGTSRHWGDHAVDGRGSASADLVARLHREIFDLHTVFEVARGFHSVPDTDALLDGLTLAAITHLGVGAAAVAISERAAPDRLSHCRWKGWDDAVAAEWALSIDSPLARLLGETHDVLPFDELARRLPAGDPKRELLERRGCTLIAPIRGRHVLRGVIYLGQRFTPAPFTFGDRRFLELLLEQVAVSLENSFLYETERESAAELLRSQDRIAQLEKRAVLGHLSAAIAHEVRNPLGIIKNHLHLLGARSTADIDAMRHIQEMRVEIDRIDRIVTGLLRAFQPERIDAEPVDLGASLSDAVGFLRPPLESRGIGIELECDPGLPSVYGTPEALRQVFVNLGLNARDAMPGGGTLTIRAAGCEDQVTITFRDTGRGIDPAIRAHLFEPFVTTKPDGTGIGLLLCRDILERFGGSISVTNTPPPGHGAAFSVILRTVAEIPGDGPVEKAAEESS